jgi:O-antigen/teichoic acid export membrane protein
MRYLSFIKKYSGYFNSVKWGSYAIFVSFLRQICLVPFFLTAVSGHAYSFWLILNTLAVLVAALSLGHLHYCSNYLNLAFHKEADMAAEFKAVNNSNYTYLLLQLALAGVLCFPPVLSFISGFSQEYISANEGMLCFLLLFGGRFVSQYTGLFVLRLMEPLGLIKKTLKYQTLSDVTDFIFTLVAIMATRSILYTTAAVFAANIAYAALLIWYVKGKVPYTISCFKITGWQQSTRFIRSSFFLNGSFVVEKIYDSGINLIVVAFFSTAALPLFYTTKVLSNIFYRFSITMILPLFPEVQKQYALKEYGQILATMKKFWAISGFVMIVAIAVGMPLIPWVYTLWTKDELHFDARLMSFLFMGVLFQNFATIVYEFYKKTNLSRQMLLLNVIRVTVMVVFIKVFGTYLYLPGLGISFFIAETMCACYSLYQLSVVFKNHGTIKIVKPFLFPVLIFSISLGFYIAYLNYLMLLVGAVLGIMASISKVKTALDKL